MALVLVEGEEKIPGLENTANTSVAPTSPQPMTLEASAAGSSGVAKDLYYILLLAFLLVL